MLERLALHLPLSEAHLAFLRDEDLDYWHSSSGMQFYVTLYRIDEREPGSKREIMMMLRQAESDSGATRDEMQLLTSYLANCEEHEINEQLERFIGYAKAIKDGTPIDLSDDDSVLLHETILAVIARHQSKWEKGSTEP